MNNEGKHCKTDLIVVPAAFRAGVVAVQQGVEPVAVPAAAAVHEHLATILVQVEGELDLGAHFSFRL